MHTKVTFLCLHVKSALTVRETLVHGRLAMCSEPAVCDATGAADATRITVMSVSPSQ